MIKWGRIDDLPHTPKMLIIEWKNHFYLAARPSQHFWMRIIIQIGKPPPPQPVEMEEPLE